MITVGVDLGGTFTRVGAIDGAGEILCRRCELTSSLGSLESAVDRIANLVRDVLKNASRKSTDEYAIVGSQIGVAFAGIVDRDRGRLVRGVNLERFEGRPICDELRARLGLGVWASTDIEASTWAEYRCREPNRDPFVHLRIGTGVGCSLINHGRPEDLPREGAGHLDILVVEDGPDARLCQCGRRGCLEAFVSGPALEQQALRAGFGSPLEQATCSRGGDQPRTGGTSLFGLEHYAREGHKVANRIVEQAAARVAIASRKITENTGTKVICIGGGVIEALPSLLAAVRRIVAENVPAGKCSPGVTIESALLGNESGIIGAALLARDASQR